MAISQLIFEKFNKYLSKSNSVLELGNQTFVSECIQKYQDVLKNYTNRTPVKNYVESFNKNHVSIDITGLDNSLPLDLNTLITNDIGKFDLVTNFGTTEHVEPNQFESFLNIHNFCKINGIMIHEIPVFGHWIGHCKFYYDEIFFYYLSNKNNYEIIEMERINYLGDGDLLFVALRKLSEEFFSEKNELESYIKISNEKIKIPEYWKNK